MNAPDFQAVDSSAQRLWLAQFDWVLEQIMEPRRPAAFIGLSPDDPKIGLCCAWHGPAAKAEAERYCERRGLRVSHGICPRCAKEAMETL